MSNLKMFHYYDGTVAAFKAAGMDVTYAEKFVAILGGYNQEGVVYFSKGKYTADLQSMLDEYDDALKRFDGIKVNGTTYSIASGGAGKVLSFAQESPSTVTVNADKDGIVIGLADVSVTNTSSTANGLDSLPLVDNITVDGKGRVTAVNKITVNIQTAINDAVSALQTEVSGWKSGLEEADSNLDERLKDVEESVGLGGSGESIDDRIATAKEEAIAEANDTALGYIKEIVSGSSTGTDKIDNYDTINGMAAQVSTNAANISTLQSNYPVTVDEVTTGLADGVLKKYTISQGGTEVGTINIPKDLVVTGGDVITATTESGLTKGEKYLKLTIANQSAPVYIAVKELVDAYTAGTGITISDSNVVAINTSEVDTALANYDGQIAGGIQQGINAAAAAQTTANEAKSAAATAQSAAETAQSAAEAADAKAETANTAISKMNLNTVGDNTGATKVITSITEVQGVVTATTKNVSDLSIAATQVTVADSAGYLDATTVEAALAEMAAAMTGWTECV